MFLPVSAKPYVTVALCFDRAGNSFIVVPKDTGGELCVDVRSSVWAAVDCIKGKGLSFSETYSIRPQCAIVLSSFWTDFDFDDRI